MKNNLKLFTAGIAWVLSTGFLYSQGSTTWQSQLVKMSEKGVLTYFQDNDGFVLPDFSQAGYRNGESIPSILAPL